jgi:serine/threonine protein kinase
MELSQEIEILKRVRHPNIIQFYDCWYNNTEFVFVTELMTSGTLREYSTFIIATFITGIFENFKFQT